jgi:hypothetical protein
MAGIIFKRILGVIALVFGATILSWFIYNQFRPTPEFQSSYFGIFQLAVPIGFLIYGWRWLRYEGEERREAPHPQNGKAKSAADERDPVTK